MNLEKIAAACLAAFVCISAANAQQVVQQSSKRSETTVEQEYLSTIEDVIIKELAVAEDHDNKLVALQYLESAVSSGRNSKEIQESLDLLAGEGVFNQSRTNGRVVNNFPDIRAKACDLLGQIKTEEAKTTLLKVALADNEPMVSASAIRALGQIGMNDNDEVIATIAWTQKKYAAINPTSSLAHEVLVAYQSLYPTVKDKNAMIQSISSIASNYLYVRPVRDFALRLLNEFSAQR